MGVLVLDREVLYCIDTALSVEMSSISLAQFIAMVLFFI